MEPFVVSKDGHLMIQSWMDQYPGLVAGFSSKQGGFSQNHYSSMNLGFHVGDDVTTVQQNRAKLGHIIDFPVQKWVGAEQTHETTIRKITKADIGIGSLSYDTAFKATDGFYTFQDGVLLTLCFADCVPLYFIAPNHHAIGVAHAGWKGTVHGIAEKMIHSLNNEGIKSSEIFVIIGPSICETCYIVDEHVIRFVDQRLMSVKDKPYHVISDGQYRLHLQNVNEQILMESGVPNENIRRTNFCTSCHPEHFYSHRRDHGKTGRMISFIGWKEALQK